MQNPVEEGSQECVEICGDGFNYGQYQCDDGNKVNGDGCSNKCVIEDGWTCGGGSTIGPDSCYKTKYAIPNIVLVNSENSIYIEFDEEVTLQGNLDASSMEVTMSGPLAPYKFTWELNELYKLYTPIQIIKLDLTFTSSIEGN